MEGRASATAKTTREIFRDIRFTRLTAIKRPTNYPTRFTPPLPPLRFLSSLLAYVWKPSVSRLRGLLRLEQRRKSIEPKNHWVRMMGEVYYDLYVVEEKVEDFAWKLDKCCCSKIEI